MKLTEEQTMQFVTSYKNHECLYDGSHPNYKCKHARAVALREMVQELGILGITIDDVKRKIKSLRSTYFLEFDKIKRLENMGICYKSKLKWFDDMSSVVEKYSKRSAENINQQEASMQSYDEIEPSTSQEPMSPDPLRINSYDVPIKQEKKAKIPIAPKRSLATLFRDLKKEIRISNNLRNSNENEFDIYGKYVATSLKKLSNQQAIYAQNQINNILTSAKMQDLLHTQTLNIASGSNDDVEEEFLEEDCL